MAKINKTKEIQNIEEKYYSRGDLIKIVKRLVSIGAIISVIIFLSFSTFYFYKKSVNISNTDIKTNSKKDKDGTSGEELNKVISRVRDTMVIPDGDVPSVAVVTDPTLLSSQAFFSNSKIGDIVLVYSSLKKVVLFDPNLNKIIDVAPLNINALGNTNNIYPSQLESTPASP